MKIGEIEVNSPDNLTIAGTLTFFSGGSYSLTVSGDLVINSGGTLELSNDADNINVHNLILLGNFTNNGTFTFILDLGDDKINVTFQASSDVSLSGSSQTDFQSFIN